MAETEQFPTEVIEDSTGLHCIEVWVTPPELPYPAFVHIETEGGSVLPDDAREYAHALLAAADRADAATIRAIEAEESGSRG